MASAPISQDLNQDSAARGGAPDGRSAAIPVLYGLTIFVSAFLLFQVQPVIAKIIVPWFGGSSAVWITCLLFFQLVLLLGYFYAHWITNHLGRKAQKFLHLGLLALGIATLPIYPSNAWKPAGPEWPTFHILVLLGAAVGLPFFLLSTTSPLLQAWYGQVRRKGKPYRFFAVSNAASMLGLLTYPVLVEPELSTRHQALGWSAGFAAFAALCAVLALGRKDAAIHEEPAPESEKPSRLDQFLWVALSAAASALLLGLTNHLTQNVAAIPFMWILPLSLYLLSLILCFEGRGWYHRSIFLKLLAVALGAIAYGIPGSFSGGPLVVVIPIFAGGLFVCCMVCHGELARLKPAPEYLTSFYLMVSLGGALGGIFVCLIAPHIFPGFFELQAGLGCCAVLATFLLLRDSESMFYWRGDARAARLGLVFVVGFYLAGLGVEVLNTLGEVEVIVRDFYGSLTVVKLDPSNPSRTTLKLGNGIIEHGRQFVDPARRRDATTYYGPKSGLGLSLQFAEVRPNLHVGVIGLGAGTIATYGRPGDLYTFYEINPLDIQLARRKFTFLGDSRAKIEIVPGDGRLSLEREPNQYFDVLAVDAFTGDAIPIHLLTREAFLLYFRHLKPDGILAVHVSNRYLDLRPVVKRVAESLGKKAVFVRSGRDELNFLYVADWMLVCGDEKFFDAPEIRNAITPLSIRRAPPLWTDDYSSVFGILK